MRPIKVEFQAFGPYPGHESVDFENIASRGLFLICGNTGSGKTMIIDAMTFALFGKSSGNGRDDFESMRCTNAEFKAPTLVSFEFEHNGQQYRFQRRLDRKTKNLSESRDVSIKDENGNWITLFENAKKDEVNKKAEEILGLTYDQFRQVIVLPQGQFEKLLTSSSNEKEEILTQIFGVDKWKRIAECFMEDAVARNEELTAVRARIRTSLDEEDCQTMEDLLKALDKASAGLKEEKKRYEDAGYEKNMNDLQQLLETSAKLAELRDNLRTRENEEKKATEDVPEKKKASGEIAEELRSHMEKEDEIEKLREEKIACEGRREDYLSLGTAVDEVEDMRKGKAEAAKATDRAEKKLADSTGALKAAKDEYDRLDEEHKALMDSYIAGITGELAKDLKDGQACPVCGSTEHPNKAHAAEGSVSKEDVEAKKAQAEKGYKKVRIETETQEKAKADFEKRKKAFDDIESDLKVAEAKLEERKKNLIQGIETAGDLEKRIETLGESITSYDRERKALETKDKEAREALALAVEKVNTTKAEREKAARAVDEALAGIRAEDVKDPAEIRSAISEIREAASSHSTRIGVMEQGFERLEKKATDLAAEGEGLEEKIRQAESDIAFGKKLRGDTGTGLQRYVLGIMFSSVVAEANRMLEMVHGGRYRLYRTDDKGKGNKRGLELKVHDRNSDDQEGRFVGTLSGGEKFLAALALSIGMANVARKSGIGIDALFIDEGFGTLDEESIGDAMSILDGIQKASGMVGIISHMGILRENIPTKLIVEGREGGSRIISQIG